MRNSSDNEKMRIKEGVQNMKQVTYTAMLKIKAVKKGSDDKEMGELKDIDEDLIDNLKSDFSDCDSFEVEIIESECYEEEVTNGV